MFGVIPGWLKERQPLARICSEQLARGALSPAGSSKRIDADLLTRWREEANRIESMPRDGLTQREKKTLSISAQMVREEERILSRLSAAIRELHPAAIREQIQAEGGIDVFLRGFRTPEGPWNVLDAPKGGGG